MRSPRLLCRFNQWGGGARVLRNSNFGGNEVYQADIKRIVRRVKAIDADRDSLPEGERDKVYPDLVTITGPRLELILSKPEQRKRRALHISIPPRVTPIRLRSCPFVTGTLRIKKIVQPSRECTRLSSIARSTV